MRREEELEKRDKFDRLLVRPKLRRGVASCVVKGEEREKGFWHSWIRESYCPLSIEDNRWPFFGLYARCGSNFFTAETEGAPRISDCEACCVCVDFSNQNTASAVLFLFFVRVETGTERMPRFIHAACA